MFKISKSYIFIVLLTALMTTSIYAQDLSTENKPLESPGVGDAFPHFQLTTTDYQSIDLYDYFQNEPVVLIYYRGGW